MSLCVVGLGELVWDHLPGKRLPGGAPANFAFHAGQLGATGYVVSAVGIDPAGKELSDWLEKVGISRDYLQSNPHPTGRVSVSMDHDNHPVYHIHSDVAWDHIQWNEQLHQLAREADCVCVGTLAQRSLITRQTAQRFLSSVRSHCLRVFDINLRAPFIIPGVIADTLRHCDVLKLNHHEWPVIAAELGLDLDMVPGARQLIEQTSVQTVAITRGENGSLVVDSQMVHDLPGQPIKIADTVGAGDAFAAALAINLMKGTGLKAAHQNAAMVSAYVCTQHGATPVLPASIRATSLCQHALV
jgi:fructokinase